MKYTIGDAFAGIGGFSLVFHHFGCETKWFIEREPFCQQVLKKHFNAPIHGDIYECHNLPHVDILTAGFPCQPFSLAGKRQGENDERYLVPELLRVIAEVKPYVVLLENVPGFPSLTNGDTFKQLLGALAEMGFDASWGHLRASDAGAPHQRERWFCVAYRTNSGVNGREWFAGNDAQGSRERIRFDGSRTNGGVSNVAYPVRNGNGKRWHGRARRHIERNSTTKESQRHDQQSRVVAHGQSVGNTLSLQGYRAARREILGTRHQQAQSKSAGCRRNITGRSTQPRLVRASHGLSSGVDRHQFPAAPGQPQHSFEPPRVASQIPQRTARLKSLGNSIVPQAWLPIADMIVSWLDAQAVEIAA